MCFLPGVLRLSIDTKATIKIGQFSRGGYNRQGAKAVDHDFKPDTKLRLFGIHIPEKDENHLYFTESNVTADFMADAMEDLWSAPETDELHTITINANNGPENSSRRTQFIRRIIGFAESKSADVSLACYPPYHSKYNPIERVRGVLENHWRGELLNSADKVIRLAKTMTWKGKNPVVRLMEGVYETGVRLSESAMKTYEKMLNRLSGLENWFVDIFTFDQ
ncbi:transposase [Desulfonema ishimotonii]|uniref:Transposase n=1 Tax=Desulfonema ishimotonii TaxID=45657 RepID=A0A401FVT6_9BACT|nr:transposase [Desulfonema ishimotonii]